MTFTPTFDLSSWPFPECHALLSRFKCGGAMLRWCCSGLLTPGGARGKLSEWVEGGGRLFYGDFAVFDRTSSAHHPSSEEPAPEPPGDKIKYIYRSITAELFLYTCTYKKTLYIPILFSNMNGQIQPQIINTM